MVVIAFCPWCGATLPNSKRDRWFAELEALGITDPYCQKIPARFLSDEWYRDRLPECGLDQAEEKESLCGQRVLTPEGWHGGNG